MKFTNFRATILAVVLATGAASAASAATVGLLGSSTNGAGNTADVFAAGFDGSLPAGATWDAGNDPLVTPPPGSIGSTYFSPFANTATGDGTLSYFSIGGGTPTNGSAASPRTLTLGSAVSSFKVLWGSIDSYNSIEVFDSGGVSLGSATGGSVVGDFGLSFGDVGLFEFSTAAGENLIKSVKFTSTTAALEIALEKTTAIPLPAGAVLLITGLAGFGALKRRRRAHS